MSKARPVRARPGGDVPPTAPQGRGRRAPPSAASRKHSVEREDLLVQVVGQERPRRATGRSERRGRTQERRERVVAVYREAIRGGRRQEWGSRSRGRIHEGRAG